MRKKECECNEVITSGRNQERRGAEGRGTVAGREKKGREGRKNWSSGLAECWAKH
jgi:hypothetical protein